MADNIIELSIPVDRDVEVGAKAFIAGTEAPSILFFHGNGEIVADYDDLGPLFTGLGLNFIPVDYRGYGRSGGEPNVSSMMKDSRIIFSFIKQWLSDRNFSGRFIVMGRSLGSASAIEIASEETGRIDGLIIESGFANTLPLLRVIGINPDTLQLNEDDGFINLDKIRKIPLPTLIIHAEHDHIIPYRDGKALYEASPSSKKRLLTIPRADHNTIFVYGMKEYLSAVTDLATGML